MDNEETPTQKIIAGTYLDTSIRDILNWVEDEILIIDKQYRIRFINSAAVQKIEKKSQPPIGMICYEALQNRDKPCTEPLWNCPLNKVIREGVKHSFIYPIHTPRADTYIKLIAYPLRDSCGDIEAIAEMRRDVTAERELESQLLIRHHQLSALHRISSAVATFQDLDTILRIALDSVLALVDSDIGGILLLDEDTKTLYYRVQRGLSPRYAEQMRMKIGEGLAGRVAQSGKPVVLDDVLEDISKDPHAVRPDLVSAEGLRGFASVPLKTKDKVIGVMNVSSHMVKRFGADDVSLLSSIGDHLATAIEQARLYHSLARAGERYQALLQHALTAQEQERKRIARELHDETSQAITSLTLNLQAIMGIAEMKGIRDAEFIGTLRTVHSYAVYAGNEIVKLMKELRPTLLDELGMTAAIHRYAKDTLQAKGINLTAEFIGTDRRFPPEVEVTLFRVAQGAIGNILQHSGAKNTSIRLECNDAECTLQICDDGRGFDVNKLTRVDPSGRGAGVFTMKERASLVGGKCNIESKPDQGTKVFVKVPVTGSKPYEENKGLNS